MITENTIVSMGHRNPQGLFVDQKNKIVLSTEHGPWVVTRLILYLLKKYNNEILNFDGLFHLMVNIMQKKCKNRRGFT